VSHAEIVGAAAKRQIECAEMMRTITTSCQLAREPGSADNPAILQTESLYL